MATKTKKARRTRVAKKSNNALFWLIGAAVAALIAIPIIINANRSSSLPGEVFRSQGNAHVQLGSATPAYNSDPPTSGWHTGELAGWGSYDYVVPDQRLVHNMEDGGVIMWYALGSAEENEENIRRLEEVASGYRRVVIVPRENMPTPYALTSWTRLQRFDDIDAEGMQTFLQAFEGIDHHR